MLLPSHGHFLNKLWNVIEKSITYVTLDQYHSLKCDEQYFSSNIINVVYVGLKLKQQSTGYPTWVQSKDDKDKYIEDYLRAEGIALDKALISKNAGQRTLAKLN